MNNWEQKFHVKSSMPNSDKAFATFIGRWQLLHAGHMALFAQSLNQGDNVCILVRDMPTDEKNPYTAIQVKENIEGVYKEYVEGGRVVVIIIPDTKSINFGRGPGYDIIEHIPTPEIAAISGTKLREEAKK